MEVKVMSDINKKKKLFLPGMVGEALPLFHKDFPILLFWNPKCGCTSLIKWFYFQIGILEEAIKYSEWIHTYRAAVFEVKPDYKLNITNELINGTKPVYKVIRNPYKRAVSSYLGSITVPQILNHIAPNLTNEITFRQFLYRIKEIGVEREVINSHIAQQYIEGEELFIKDYIRLENFNSEIRNLEKKYGLITSPLDEITKSYHHVSHKMTQSTSQSFADVKMYSSVISGSNLPAFEKFYDTETIQLVQEIYEKDFIMLGYNPNKLS
jgi:hypothetical protein